MSIRSALALRVTITNYGFAIHTGSGVMLVSGVGPVSSHSSSFSNRKPGSTDMS